MPDSNIQAVKARVQTERIDLHEKLQRLEAFRDTANFRNLGKGAQNRLVDQLTHMWNYWRALGNRLEEDFPE